MAKNAWTPYLSFHFTATESATTTLIPFTSTPTTTTSIITTTTTASTTSTTETSPNRNAVLVLSTRRWRNKPFIIDFNGKCFMSFSNIDFSYLGNMNEDLNFEYGDGADTAELYAGCGGTLHNIFWYFGGHEDYGHQRRVKLENYLLDIYVLFQASKLVGCNLERQADLKFGFYRGACNTFHQPDPRILLCFDTYNNKQCHTLVLLQNRFCLIEFLFKFQRKILSICWII